MITVSGSIGIEELAKWIKQSKMIVTKDTKKFNIVLDLRQLSPLSSAVYEIIDYCHRLLIGIGLHRSSLIINQGFIATQFKLIAHQFGNYEMVRYMDATNKFDCMEIAVNWVKYGIEPNLNDLILKSLSILDYIQMNSKIWERMTDFINLHSVHVNNSNYLTI